MKRKLTLEERVEMLEKMLRMQIGDIAWEYHYEGKPIRDTANDIGHPDCGSMN